MENLNVVYNRDNREIADLETDEVFTSKEIRMMYPDIHYQYMAPPLEDRRTEIERQAEVAESARPKPLELSPEEEQWWRDNRPYLFYADKSREQVFWAKMDNLMRRVANYAEKKKRRQCVGYLWHDIEFAWQMLDEAGELLGFEPINSVVRDKVTEDLWDPAIRRKYQRRIDRCLKAGETVPVDILRYRVYVGGRQ